MAVRSDKHKPIQPKQLRRLHALWHRWTGRLKLSPEADRQLRHYYIWLLTQYQCAETKALTEAEAALVIEWLARLVRQTEASQNYVAGTAGRQGYPERRRVPPSPAAWRALWGCAAELHMERSDLDHFIRRHYAGAGLGGLADLHTMADLNRVLWGLKAMLRHGEKSRRFPNPGKRAA
ncbi:MAG: hypothetical protein HY316_02595 [Acidobacteria bacterium]|nr:hypothetical protein [Acidobacteriota bacterium]